MRHPIDLELRIAPLGDVLKDDDGPLALHAMDGDFEGTTVLSFERNRCVGQARVVEKGVRKMGAFCSGDDVAVDKVPEDGVQMGADEGRVRPHAENPERLIVCQDNLTACVEHAEAVRHVVESRVQPRRQRCGLLLRGDHPVEVGSEAFGRTFHVEDQRRDPHDDPHGIPTARDKHGCAQRSKGSYELHVDAAINGVTARHQTEGVGDRHRYAEKLSETVVRYGERKQGPQREAEQTEEGAKRENPLLMARNFDRGARHAPSVAAYKVEPKRRDYDLSGSRVEKHRLPGRERGSDFAAGDRNGRKQHHRNHVVEQAVDESDVNLVRQLVGRR